MTLWRSEAIEELGQFDTSLIEAFYCVGKKRMQANNIAVVIVPLMVSVCHSY